MKHLILFSAALITGGFLLLSCSDNPTRHGSDDIFTQADFPQWNGSTWIYEVYDSTAAHYDTVTVGIEGWGYLPSGRTAYEWVYHYPDRIDTFYSVVKTDTNFFYSDKNEQALSDKLIFPMLVGKFWSNYGIGDTTRIIQKGSVTTILGTFRNSFKLSTNWDMIDNAGTINNWLVKGIGRVKYDEYRVTIAGLSVRKWQLIGYIIPTVIPFQQ